MKEKYHALLRWLLRRRDGENVFMPIFRYYSFYMGVVSFLLVGMCTIILPTTPLEIVYTLIVVALILFLLKFAFYWITGKVHGRLGFKRSGLSGVMIAIVAGGLWLVVVLNLKRFTGGVEFPWVYSTVSTLMVPLFLFTGAKYLGSSAADWVEETGPYANDSPE